MIYPSSPLGETEGDVPTGRDVEWEPLVDYRRNGVSETTIHGAVAWYDGGKLSIVLVVTFLLWTLMEPLMLKVFADELDDLNWEQKAYLSLSHSSTSEHVKAAQCFLKSD